MPLPVCYLNGSYLPLAEARISPLDRAFLFGDAVYEVIPVHAGRPFRFHEHFDRLARSLEAIRMPAPLSHADWATVCSELVRRNGGGDQSLYVQVSRGAESGRNHAWPEGLVPTVFAFASRLEPVASALLEQGVAAITAADIRWARRDIKSTALLANVLLKKLAQDAGAFETIVAGGVIRTPPNGRRILPGTTRDVVVELAGRTGIATETARITEAALRGADEIWLAFSTRGVLPVTRLDGVPVGDGRPGPLFLRLHAAFARHLSELAGKPL
jgi:D-alanine transaminase